MSGLPRAKTTEGKPYVGNQQFAGQGVKRSCAKCSQFFPIGQLKLRKPWGSVCPACKGDKL